MDPLSVAASVAGLIALVAKAAEIARELYNTVKQKSRILKSLADDLAIFHAVLGDLRSRLADGGNEEEQGALKSVSASCERTVRKLQEHLISLREMSSKNLAHRLYSHSKYKATMAEIEEMREDLAAFKLTLNIAIHLRATKQSENLVTAADVKSLWIKMADLVAQTQKMRTSQSLHPIQQYIDISGTVITETTPDIAADDIESIKSFRGYADWIKSWSPNRPCQPPAVAIAKPVNTISKDAKVLLRIRNLGPIPTRNNEASQLTTRVEIIEMAMTDYFYTGIEALHQRGYKGVCGFRMGSQLLSPLSEPCKPVPVYVTEGPSSYSLDWLEIHMDEPLEEFYDNFVRAEDKRKTGLTTRIRDNELEIRDEHFDTCTAMSLNRTLRLPEDGVTYNLPGLFGQFPIINVDFLHGKLPEAMIRKSGVIVPIYSREAISIGIRSIQRRPARESLAIRVLSGGINVISGLGADKAPNAGRQDHIISPAQKRLDGFLAAPDRGRSVVQQFVAMPTGEGYTVECQITGEEVVNGIQLIVAPPFAGRGKFFLDLGAGGTELAEQEKSPTSLGFKPGTQLLMSGEEIESHYKKKHASFEDDGFLVPRQSFSRYYEYKDLYNKFKIWGSSMPRTRPARTHEVLWPILEQHSQFDSMELELEAVFEMNITVKEYPYRKDVRDATWSLSPFTPMEKLYQLVKSEFNLGDGGELELRYSQTVLPRDGSMLHDVSADGGVITFMHFTLPSMMRTADEEPRPVPILPTWEMGLAPGNKTYQDVYADADVNQWDWKKSQLLNVQFLNAVAFESFTGISPPTPPFSFAAYVDAGIPFYHIMPNSGILRAETALQMETVSQIDDGKVISKGTSIQGPRPVECVLCERMLADTM
ncbi:hypothetical protein FNYG_13159 [Fusarium nygamai]|uniref:Azaphilone pigments biosynthesis cluster protein L N-terminal domain-containing protein n=1 Tax=Gibberella nygamai TaxID=42673 RepID=A0A2K0VU12_GIBNY|nr:hypothetical protein FNYG_13159 [Fusarium nygamai]